MLYIIIFLLIIFILLKPKNKCIEYMDNNIYYLSSFKDLDINVSLDHSKKYDIINKLVEKYSNLNVNDVINNIIFAVTLNNNKISLLGHNNGYIHKYTNNSLNKLIDTKLDKNINMLPDGSLILGKDKNVDLNFKIQLQPILPNIFLIIKDDKSKYEISTINNINNSTYTGDNHNNNYYIIKSSN
jgi:hypothetical protein